MTVTSARRIARVRPVAPVAEDEYFFVANDAPDFGSDAGKVWTVTSTPFPASAANAGSRPRSGWEIGATVDEASFTFLAPSIPANVLGMAHNTGRAGRDLPPQAFHKAATSVVGPGDAIELRPGVGRVEPEAELTIVVGSKARGLTARQRKERDSGLHHRKRRLRQGPAAIRRVVDQCQEPGHVHARGAMDRHGSDGRGLGDRNPAQRRGAQGSQLRRSRLEGGGNPRLSDLLHDAAPWRPRADGIPCRVCADRSRRHCHLPYCRHRRTDESRSGRRLRSRRSPTQNADPAAGPGGERTRSGPDWRRQPL